MENSSEIILTENNEIGEPNDKDIGSVKQKLSVAKDKIVTFYGKNKKVIEIGKDVLIFFGGATIICLKKKLLKTNDEKDQLLNANDLLTDAVDKGDEIIEWLKTELVSADGIIKVLASEATRLGSSKGGQALNALKGQQPFSDYINS